MQRKLAVALGVIMLALIALIGAIYRIIYTNNDDYNKIVLSQRQASYDSRTIPFRRGDIMDRNGTVLATSQKVYNLILDPKVIYSRDDGRYVDATVQALSEYFGYDQGELKQLLEERKDKSYVKYQKQLSYDDKSGWEKYVEDKNKQFAASGDKARVKGVWFEDEYTRTYPYNSLACNVIGFSTPD
ncbi:MAG: penicillin-binding protein 2, partial [Oribacterium sp.]|nr:penicillin-binding protein 2 [Oribacterium sp.]